MVILASEDVGLADPRALLVAVAAAHAVEHVGLPEAQLNLAQAALYLARGAEVERVRPAIWAARQDVREHGNLRPPDDAAATGVTRRARSWARRGVRLSARRSGGLRLEYLPEQLRGRRYYRPSGSGEESERADSDG